MSGNERHAFVSAEAAAPAGAHRDAVRAFRLLSVISPQIRRLTDGLFRSDDVTAPQAALITVVKDLGRPSISEVAAQTGTSHQNVKQIALGLQRKGFLDIVEDPQDKRVRRLVVTAASDRYWADRDHDDFEEIGRWFRCLTAAEITTLVSLLAMLHTGLRDELTTPEPGEATG